MDLDQAERVLSSKGYDILSNPGVMLVVRKGAEITIYPGGRLLMHPVKEREQAERLAKQVYQDLGR